MSYTYNPVEVGAESISRARFELGDTITANDGAACMLCDEEIQAVIDSSATWKSALYKLACAVCMKLSYETDWRDDGAAFNLNQRAERWQKLRDELAEAANISLSVPKSGAVEASLANPTDGGHAFRTGMMQSPYVQPPSPYGEGEGT